MVDYGAEMIDLHAERLFEAKWIRGTLRRRWPLSSKHALIRHVYNVLLFFVHLNQYISMLINVDCKVDSWIEGCCAATRKARVLAAAITSW